MAPIAYILLQTASDNCTRANENPMSDGGNWTEGVYSPVSAGQLASDLFEPTATSTLGYVLWTGNGVFANDQYSEITVHAWGNNSNAYAAVRGSLSAGTFYIAVMSGSVNQLSLLKYVGGSLSTTFYQQNISFSVGDKIRLVVQGSLPATLTVYHNGTLLTTQTDSSSPITSGYSGMAVYSTSSITAAQISAWTGGIVLASPTDTETESDSVANTFSGLTATVFDTEVESDSVASSEAVSAVMVSDTEVESDSVAYGLGTGRSVSDTEIESDSVKAVIVFTQLVSDTEIESDSVTSKLVAVSYGLVVDTEVESDGWAYSLSSGVGSSGQNVRITQLPIETSIASVITNVRVTQIAIETSIPYSASFIFESVSDTEVESDSVTYILQSAQQPRVWISS